MLIFQERVEVPAERTSAGAAEKEEILGVIPDNVVLDAILEDAEILPTLSCAVA